MQNSPGQIDSDYRGEWMIKFEAIPLDVNTTGRGSLLSTKFTLNPFPYKVGDRVAQIFFERVIPMEFEEVEELSTSDRKGGFGSTGVK